MYKAFSADQVYATQQEAYAAYAWNASDTYTSIWNTTAGGTVYAVNNSTGLAQPASGSSGVQVLFSSTTGYSFLVVSASNDWGSWLHATYGRHYSASVSFTASALGVASGTLLDNQAIATYRGLAQHFGMFGDEQEAIWIDTYLLTSAVFLSVAPQLRGDRLRRGFVQILLSTASAQVLPTAAGSVAAYGASTFVTASDVPFFNNTERVLGSSLGYLSSSTHGYIGKINYETGLIALDVAKLARSHSSTDYWFVSGSDSLTLAKCLQSSSNFVTWGLLQRLKSITWNSVTDNSLVTYYCHATPGDFNYSSNPTFTELQYLTSTTGRWSGSRAFGTTGRTLTLSGTNYVRTYVTGIGLFDSNNGLVAVAKINRPVEKKPGDWLTFAVPVTW